MINIHKKMLIEAKLAMKNAYVPITNKGVGAAVLTYKNNIYKGCNVQSVISGLGTCAERSAIDNMAANGEYQIKSICIYSSKHIYPCGVCLQYLAEFSEIAARDIEIVMIDSKNRKRITSLHQLLPHIYGPKEGHKNLKRYKKGG